MEKESDTDMLARMIAEGFSSVEKRFNGLDERMDGLEERIDGLDGRMESLDGRMDGLERAVRETNALMDKNIIPTLDEHAHRIKALEEQAA